MVGTDLMRAVSIRAVSIRAVSIRAVSISWCRCCWHDKEVGIRVAIDALRGTHKRCRRKKAFVALVAL